MGQLVSGYLDFAERQAEREQAMTMRDWAEHLDRILTMSGEQLLQGNGSISHKQAVDKAMDEYKKYKARTLSTVEEDYLNSIKILEKKQKKNSESISGISGLAFPVYYEGFEGEVIRLLNENTVETVCLLSKLNAKQHIEVELNLDEMADIEDDGHTV